MRRTLRPRSFRASAPRSDVTAAPPSSDPELLWTVEGPVLEVEELLRPASPCRSRELSRAEKLSCGR